MKVEECKRQETDLATIAGDGREAYVAPTLERLGSVTELTASSPSGSGSDAYHS